MTAAGVQDLLARLMADPSLYPEVHAAPESFAAHYGITVADVERLCAVGGQGLLVSSAVARRNKLALVEGVLPATLALCRTALDDAALCGRFLATSRLTTPEGMAEAGMRLGAFAVRQAPDTDRPAIGDVVRYETLRHDAMWRFRERRPQFGAVGPTLRPGVVVATFGCPVAAVQRRIADGAPWRDLGERRTHLVLAPAGGGRVLVHRIPEGLRSLLDLCDGSRSPAELAEARGLSTEAVERALSSTHDMAITRPSSR
ncbi:hypothetical protein [Streptomyces sp. MAR4 CNX-425]|uniref:hypothetical protein n=1 Tax=Streptomyces sp. MAR4 CNX-425 TaxID=3406343 RepID=UPI003B50E938